MSLSRVQKIFMPASINAIVLIERSTDHRETLLPRIFQDCRKLIQDETLLDGDNNYATRG